MASHDFEGTFGACLLMIGPPDYLGSGDNEERLVLTSHGGVQRVSKAVAVVSSLDYMIECSKWYSEHVHQLHSQRLSFRKRFETDGFNHWWTHYKRWLLKHGGNHGY